MEMEILLILLIDDRPKVDFFHDFIFEILKKFSHRTRSFQKQDLPHRFQQKIQNRKNIFQTTSDTSSSQRSSDQKPGKTETKLFPSSIGRIEW